MIKDEDFPFESMIYRFRSNFDYNYDSLLKNEIYASTPNILNDPLDCAITYDLNKLYSRLITRESFIHSYADSIFPQKKKSRKDFDGLVSYMSYLDKSYNDARDKLLNPKNSYTVKEFIKGLASEIMYKVRECFGVVSFSLNCGSRIMWSHYASNYSGFVLGYNLREFNNNVNAAFQKDPFLRDFSDICGLYKVKYLSFDEFIDGTNLMYELICRKTAKKYKLSNMVDIIKNTKYREVLLSFLTSKEKSWEYEDEIRLIFPRIDFLFSIEDIFEAKKSQFFKVAANYCPSKIIIGSKMSSINRAIIGYYSLKNSQVILGEIDTSSLAIEKCLSYKLIKPQDLIK